MPTTSTDTLDMIFDLAADAGVPQCLCCVMKRTGQAGTLDGAPRDSGDLLDMPATVAAAQLVFTEAQDRGTFVYTGELSAAVAVKRLRMVAYVASRIMPPVIYDYDARYALQPLSDGFLPIREELDSTLSRTVTAMAAYLASHDDGDWIDPNALAGAVTDLHDAAHMLETWWDLVASGRLAAR